MLNCREDRILCYFIILVYLAFSFVQHISKVTKSKKVWKSATIIKNRGLVTPQERYVKTTCSFWEKKTQENKTKQKKTPHKQTKHPQKTQTISYNLAMST